jgi:alanyl-tRNA synthetase
LRRIEAVTGNAAEKLVKDRFAALDQIARIMKTTLEEAPKKLISLNEEIKRQTKLLENFERIQLRQYADSLYQKRIKVRDIDIVKGCVPSTSMRDLRELGDILKEKLGSGVVALGSDKDGKASFILMVTPDLTGKGLNAQTIIKEIARVAGGSGGGNTEMAQAGSKDIEKIDDALAAAIAMVDKVRGDKK